VEAVEEEAEAGRWYNERLMTKETQPAQRVYGSEVEYSFTQPGINPKLSALTTEQLSIPPFVPNVGEFLGNGGRLYKDLDLVEYATPECMTLSDLVLHEIAGEYFAHYAIRNIEEIGTLHKRAIDSVGMFAYGVHENYSTPMDLWNSADIQRFRMIQILATHLATRTIFTGSGFYDSGSNYHIGQEMDYIYNVSSTETTRLRPLVNMRNEPHDGTGTEKRLHITCGDGNLSPWAILMKFGTTSLVLRLLEQGWETDSMWMLDRPVDAAKETADGVIGMKRVFKASNGEYMSAIDVQEYLHSRCEAMAEVFEIPEDERAVLSEWGAIIDALRRFVETEVEDDLLAQIDWYTRRKVVERGLVRSQYRTPRDRKKYEVGYDMIPDGVGSLLRKAGRPFSSHSPAENDIEKALIEPPQGRARLRGAIVSAAHHEPDKYFASSINWGQVEVNRRRVQMPLLGQYDDEKVQRTLEHLRG